MLHILVDQETAFEIRDSIASIKGEAIEIDDISVGGEMFGGHRETMSFEDTATNTMVELVSREDFGDVDHEGQSNLWEVVIYPGFTRSEMINSLTDVLSNKDRKEIAQKLSQATDQISSITEDFNSEYLVSINAYTQDD